jgi:uncharacterized protein with HEPN domain
VRDDRERLRDVLEAIERIEKYTLRGQEALANEELLQTWVAHHLMIIGEACRALSADFRTTHPAEVRALAAGLRNVIVHEYFGIDLGGCLECDRARSSCTQREGARNPGSGGLNPASVDHSLRLTGSREKAGCGDQSHCVTCLPARSCTRRSDSVCT